MDTTAAQPTAAPATTPSTSPSLTLTEAAVLQVKEVMAQNKLEDHFLSIRVVPAGCSGLGYDLNLVKDTKQGDLIWEQDGVRIASDAMSAQYLKGTVVDYLKSDTHSGFKFENPNAKSTCGCGSSFSA